MYNEEGESVWERSLDSCGRVKDGNHGACPFMYQGQYYDKEIELAYNRFRYYDPNDGRYISIDPIGLNSGEYGLYNYVGDPNCWIDVFGLAKNYKKKKTETFVRFMSEQEANRTKAQKGLVPSINRDTGRINRKARWISKKGDERKGTNKYNTHRVEFEVEAGTHDRLKDRAIDAEGIKESEATDQILSKTNESNSYGLGHETLDSFNSSVIKVKVTKL